MVSWHPMELVMPEGSVGSTDLPLLRRAYARRLLRIVQRPAFRSEVARRVATLASSSPELIDSILLEPAISVLLETGRSREALGAIAFALAHHRLLGTSRRELALLDRLWSVEANLAIEGGALALSDGRVFVDGREHAFDTLHPQPAFPDATSVAGVTHPFPTIAGRIRFARLDPNPFALDETHPEKDGNALSLGDRTQHEWLASLRTALSLVETHLPSVAAEMHAMLRMVIPVGASNERHLSASYREYIGAVYVSLHPDPVTMAEALIHEFQHNKLNLLSWHYPILENGYDFLYRSPVRPDPRPLMGILLAAHAFVPVAEFHRRVLEAGPSALDLGGVERRLGDVVSRNEEALRVLALHGRAAPAGALLLERLAAIHGRHRSAVADIAPNVSHVA